MTALQRRIELPHPVPLLGDDLGVDRAVGPAHQAGQRPVVAPGVEAVEALLLEAADAGAEPPPQHRERGEVDLRVAVGVGVVLLQLQVALVVAEPVEHERRVPVGAFDRRAVERRVVVGDEGIELQGEVAEPGAVGLLQDLAGHGEPLPVAGRRPAFAPVERGIEAGDGVHQRRQGGALRLLGHLPVADPLELLVGDALGDLGHRVQADVAAVRQHDGQERAHVLRVTPPALGGGHEVVGEAQVVIDLDEQVREPDRAHLLGQPFPQVAQPRLRRGVQRLGGVLGQVPAVLIHRGVGVAGRRLEEEVVGRVQPLRQMVGDVLGVGGQAGPLEEGLPERLPALLREEVVLEPAEPLAVLDREVARPQIVLELQQQGALPRLPVRLAVGHDQGQQPLRDEVRGGVLGEFSLEVGVHLLEDPKGLQAGDIAVTGVREEFQGAEQDRGELPQVAEPSDEAVEHVALLAGDPFVQPRHLGLQGVSGHGGEQPRAQGGGCRRRRPG